MERAVKTSIFEVLNGQVVFFVGFLDGKDTKIDLNGLKVSEVNGGG